MQTKQAPAGENEDHFDTLLDELSTLSKSMQVDEDDNEDDSIRAAAGRDRDDDRMTDEDDERNEDEDDEDDEDEDEKDPDEEYEDRDMSKSFSVQLADGSTAEVFDGASALAALQSAQSRQAKQLSKSAHVIAQQTKLLKSQSTRIGKLTDAIDRLGDSGRGRKASLTVFNKGGAADNGASDGVAPKEFMSKALSAQKAGRITGADVARVDSYLGRGLEIPNDLVSAVMGDG